LIPFPLPAESPHAGIPLGNGTFGALVWGGSPPDVLRVTINRQDYWQHAGEIHWQPGANHAAVCERMTRGDLDLYLPELIDYARQGDPAPTRLPVGRFDLLLGAPIQAAWLDPLTGAARIETGEGLVELVVLRDRPLMAVRGPVRRLTAVPNNSPEVAAYRQKYQMPEPVSFHGNGGAGWYQVGLDGQVLCAAARQDGGATWLTCALANSVEDARERAFNLLGGEELEFKDVLAHSKQFFAGWWRQSAWLEVEHRPTQTLFDLGLFKLSGLTQPGSPAPTLQGPWVEDDRMPPWGSDYHFNVNYQMCHWPMLAGNHLEQFEPGIAMIAGWFDQMHDYAQLFAGIDDGLMLPHAVDDRCIPADTNWRCQFDPGSIGWTALLYWDLFRYGGDRQTLRAFTYPLMRGAIRLYESLLEERGDALALKRCTSPEFFPSREGLPALLDWGENSSFHLAILHALLRAALRAADLLQLPEPCSESWRAIQSRLPRNAQVEGRIALFEGLDLVKSHRHHSHLAGIYPFDVLDGDGADRDLVLNSLRQWVHMGQGAWSGWCLPWAAILWARVDQPTAAGAVLDQYRRFFTGPNYASRHDAVADGLSVFRGHPEIMQIDAAMGAVAAICEMLAHERGGEVHLAPAVPEEWGDVAFGRLRLPGGRFASGRREKGKWVELTVSEPEFEV
jgi:hypothetical protein